MSQEDVDKIKQKINEGAEWAQNQAGELERGLNDGLSAASSSLREGISYALNQASMAQSHAEELSETAAQQWNSTEDKALEFVRGHVRNGIRWAKEYPYAAYGLAAMGILLFPAPRAFISRNIFGAMQSQESAFRGAKEKYATLSETSATLLKTQEDATVKASKALDELLAAQSAATAAHDELTSLSYKLKSTATSLDEVQDTLSPLKHDDVTVLQADVARTSTEVSSKYKEVSRLIAKLQSNGA